MEGNLGATVLSFLCLLLYFRTIFKCKPPGACIRRKDLTEGFYVTGLAGLYKKGLIFGMLKVSYHPGGVADPLSALSAYEAIFKCL